MNRSILIGYQLLIGLSDTLTGTLLILAPAFTLTLMRVHAPDDALPFLSFIGAFVLSVGLACFYGALLTLRGAGHCRIEMIWGLTAITRASVASLVIAEILSHRLEAGWATVALTDGASVIIQAIGLRKGWLRNVAH